MAAHLTIIAGYPPPFGGVTTHVRRLCNHLAAEGVPYLVYNTTSDATVHPLVVSVVRRRGRWLLRYILKPEDCTYILSPRLAVWVAGAMIARRRGRFVALRLQNSAVVQAAAAGGARRRLVAATLRRYDRIVCVNTEIEAAVRALGVAPERVRHFPGYLSPAVDELAPESVVPAVWRFIDGRSPLLCASGRVSWHEGRETYGFDQLIELVGRLAATHSNVALVVCLWEYVDSDEEHLQTLMDRATELGVGDRILFNRERGGFLPVIAACQVLVRPTVTDGDANSVREALALGLPVVASDVVARPAGTIVFRVGDVDALTSAVLVALGDGPPKQDEADAARVRTAAYVDEIRAWLAS